MTTATQVATDALRESAGEMSERVRAGAERARGELDPWLRRADEVTRGMVADYPLTALLGAAAAGYLIGRMLAASR